VRLTLRDTDINAWTEGGAVWQRDLGMIEFCMTTLHDRVTLKARVGIISEALLGVLALNFTTCCYICFVPSGSLTPPLSLI
jgi:hypothetical protein